MLTKIKLTYFVAETQNDLIATVLTWSYPEPLLKFIRFHGGTFTQGLR